MLPKVVLVLLQAAGGYAAAPHIKRLLPSFGAADMLVLAVIFAVLVWLIGMLGSVVLKDIAAPSAATLTAALLGGLILAGATYVPAVTQTVSGLVKGITPGIYPLVGAILGYLMRR